MDHQHIFIDLVAVFGVVSLFAVVIYRLNFHPLSNIPGPKLAAVSRLYEFYYQCVKGAKYAFRIEEMHEQYGE